MALNDPLASALSAIKNAEIIGRSSCAIHPISKTIKEVLTVMNDQGYIGELKTVENESFGKAIVQLLGKINDCKAIKPRFAIKTIDYEKTEKRYLPAKDFGIIIISTSLGIMDHKKAKEKNLGGKLLAYCY